MTAFPVAACLSLTIVLGASGAGPAQVSVSGQPAFRVRGEFTAPLNADRDVITDAVDSQQPGADIVLDGNTLHLLFIEPSSHSIFSTRDDGGWQPTALQVGRILGSWVRGNVYRRRDGVRVYGYVYDAGSNGGAGMNRFGEIVLSRR